MSLKYNEQPMYITMLPWIINVQSKINWRVKLTSLRFLNKCVEDKDLCINTNKIALHFMM